MHDVEYLAQVIRERDEAREQAERAERERDTLVRMLVSEFGWADQSYLHAVLHGEPAIRNLRTELEVSYKFHDVAVTERDAERMMNRVLRADIERLRNALAAISLAEYESTSSASEKVHGNARIARKALEDTK